jgi:biopolymer transport protein ExbD
MQFEGRKRTSNIPNLTPLIDIVFLLLVFFMLTSHFVQDKVINIDLPEASSGKTLEKTNPIEVVINAKGHYLINDQLILAKQLETILAKKLSHQKEKIVRIRADKTIDLGKAIIVFDAAQLAGASGVDIITTKPINNL